MKSTETEGPLLRQANLISNVRMLGLLLNKFFLIVGRSQEETSLVWKTGWKS